MDDINYIDEFANIESYARANRIPVILGEGRAALEYAITRVKPYRILEIGTAIGYSGGIMLVNARADTRLDTIELDSDRMDMAKANLKRLGLIDRVTFYQGDAASILPDICDENRYDFIFLDGPKSQYIAYLPIIKSAMATGAVLFADNVLFRGMVAGDALPPRRYRTIIVNLRKFLNAVEQDDELTMEILQEGDGIAIVTKK